MALSNLWDKFLKNEELFSEVEEERRRVEASSKRRTIQNNEWRVRGRYLVERTVGAVRVRFAKSNKEKWKKFMCGTVSAKWSLPQIL